MTFERFAQVAGYSVPHLRNVENGSREMTADLVSAYDKALATGGAFRVRFTAVRAQAAAAQLPWGQEGTLEVLTGLLNGSAVDRRSFVATSGVALTALASRWESGLATRDRLIAGGSRQVSPFMVDHIDQRLEYLRHLDDELGSGDLAALAQNELSLIAQLLRNGRHTDAVSRRLYSLASEASRQIAWTRFDQRDHTAAQRYFGLSLRASATASDPMAGAYALSFMAVQSYSMGQSRDAISLLETAQNAVNSNDTPLMSAMLAARSARAWSKLGDRRRCARMLREAQSGLDRGPSPNDPPYLYWVTEGEIEMIAGSSALELGDPAEAVRRFDAAMEARYPGEDKYPRSHAIYMTRAAEAHIALGDLEAAVDRAGKALRCLGGVDSARSTSTFAGLKARLQSHSDARAVREFLEETR